MSGLVADHHDLFNSWPAIDCQRLDGSNLSAEFKIIAAGSLDLRDDGAVRFKPLPDLSSQRSREPGTEPSFELLTRALAENGLAKWMLPEEVVVWEGEFPTTATGKVKRAAVAEGGGRMRRLLAPRLRDMDSR